MKPHRKAAPAPQPSYAVGDLVLTRFGFVGSQIARVVDLDGGLVCVRKWRENSERWTHSAWIPARAIVGVPAQDDRRRPQIAAADGAAATAAKGGTRC